MPKVYFGTTPEEVTKFFAWNLLRWSLRASKRRVAERSTERRRIKRLWTATHPDSIKKASENERGRAIERATAWAKQNPKRRSEISMNWAKCNRNPVSKLRQCLRSRLHRVLSHTNQSKCAGTMMLIGCTIPELRVHLESLFQSGMSWENYGQWHVDHRKPCASFDLSDPEQQKICFHWSNLQPLWAIDNLRKGAKCQ